MGTVHLAFLWMRSLQAEIAAEKQKIENWRQENVRRRFNYTPFMFNILQLLVSGTTMHVRVMPPLPYCPFHATHLLPARLLHGSPQCH